MPILSRTSSSLMFSFQVLLVSASLLSAALMLKFSVPAITEFSVHEVPTIINGVVLWLKPPYLYLVINCIIITILASSKFQSKNDEISRPLPSPPPPLETAAHIQPQLPVIHIAENLHPDEYKYDGVVLSSEEVPEGYVNDIVDSSNGFSHVEAGGLGDETVFNVNADSIKEDATSNKENQFVISKSRWMRKDMPEYSFSNEKPRPPPPPPPVSERFGSRRNIKASPKGGKTVLGVSKPNMQDTLQSTWKITTERRAMPLTRHLRKSDTWERDSYIQGRCCHFSQQHQKNTPQKITKAETFNHLTNTTSPQPSPSPSGSRKLKREASSSQDELNRRVEAFIKKFNEEMRLQRRESLNQYIEMINCA